MHVLILVFGAFLGGLAGFAIAGLYGVDPRGAAPLGALLIGLVLFVARTTDDPLACPECGTAIV